MSNFLRKSGAVAGLTIGGTIAVVGIMAAIAMPFAGAYFGAVFAAKSAVTYLGAGLAGKIFVGAIGGLTGLTIGGAVGKVTALLSTVTGLAIGSLTAGAGSGLSKLSSLLGRNLKTKPANKATKGKRMEMSMEMSMEKSSASIKKPFSANAKKASNKNNQGVIHKELKVNKPVNFK